MEEGYCVEEAGLERGRRGDGGIVLCLAYGKRRCPGWRKADYEWEAAGHSLGSRTEVPGRLFSPEFSYSVKAPRALYYTDLCSTVTSKDGNSNPAHL